MENKGFTDQNMNVETPNDVNITEKPLKSKKIFTNRVDINVLKSKLKESEDKAFKKNIFILSTLILTLGVIGIYVSF